jgi:hypothetical protein
MPVEAIEAKHLKSSGLAEGKVERHMTSMRRIKQPEGVASKGNASRLEFSGSSGSAHV